MFHNLPDVTAAVQPVSMEPTKDALNSFYSWEIPFEGDVTHTHIRAVD